MAVAGHSAVNIRTGRKGAGIGADAVGCGIAGNDGVFQGHASGADANSSARTLSRGARRQAGAALVDSAVPRLSTVTTDRRVLDVQRRCVVVGNRTAIGNPAVAVLALSAGGDVRWSTIAAVTTFGRVAREGCRIDKDTPAIRQ